MTFFYFLFVNIRRSYFPTPFKPMSQYTFSTPPRQINEPFVINAAPQKRKLPDFILNSKPSCAKKLKETFEKDESDEEDFPDIFYTMVGVLSDLDDDIAMRTPEGMRLNGIIPEPGYETHYDLEDCACMDYVSIHDIFDFIWNYVPDHIKNIYSRVGIKGADYERIKNERGLEYLKEKVEYFLRSSPEDVSDLIGLGLDNGGF